MTTISEKRSNETDDVYYKANVVLVDIEGTTTSIDFVKNTLFPYVRKNLEVYLKSKWNDDEFKEDLKLLQEQSKQDEADGKEGFIKIPEGFSEEICEDVKKNVLWQMDLDRKTKALKQLQGHIWRDAYNKGEVKAHVYPDVAPALKSWKQSGKDIYVYSSGSVEAQKLLFGHTQDGNLLELFSGYFDTTVGAKAEESSYSNIVNAVKCKSEEILFFTDVPKEARAAKSAGLQAVIVVREGNLPITDDDKLEFPVIKSFDDIVFETSVKRRKKSEEGQLEQGKTNSAVVEVSSMQDVEMQEEPIAVKTETSKATEVVSSTEMVEAVEKQPASVEPCATSEETKQNCKEKDTESNNELASTKKTGDKSAAEVTEKNETISKTLHVNGAENLDAGSDKNQTESNGPKCPKDNVPESDVNNIDNLPVTGKVDVVPVGKTELPDKTKLNDKTEVSEDDSKICDGSSLPTDKASANSDTADSKGNVGSVTDKTESTSLHTAELHNKTESTHSEKTENVCAKTECTTDNSESIPVCKTESLNPIDADSAITKKTESEVNKTEPMETDDLTSGDLKNKDEPVHKDKIEVKPGVRETDSSPPVGSAESKTADGDKPEAVGKANADSGKAATEATPDGDKAAVEAPSDSSKVKGAVEATPASDKAAEETTSNGSKVEVADEATPDGDKVKVPVKATSDGAKVELAAGATPRGDKVEAAKEAIPEGDKVEAAKVATPEGDKIEAAKEATPEGDKVEAAKEATPEGDKVEAAKEATPEGDKVEAAKEATPEGDKVEAAKEATTGGDKVEAAKEATTGGDKVEAAKEATPEGDKVEAAKEATPEGDKVEAAKEATPEGDKVEAAKEATPEGDKVEAAKEATPDGGKVEAAKEATPDGGKVEAAEEATQDGGKVNDADVATVTSDVKAVSVVSEAEVKVDNENDVPMEDAEPMVTDDTAKPKDKEECEPMVTDDSEPMATDQAKPITEGAKDPLTNDAEPMVTDDAEPMDTSKDETVNSKENDSEKPKTAQPQKNSESKESNECTKNVLSDTAPVNDNTNCNSVSKDIAVKDTKESAATEKADAAADKDSEALNTKTESPNTENKISKAEDKVVGNGTVEIEVEKNGMNSSVQNGESTDKADNTSEKLKKVAESTDKVVENVVSA